MSIILIYLNGPWMMSSFYINIYCTEATSGCASLNMNGLYLDMTPGTALLSQDGVLV